MIVLKHADGSIAIMHLSAGADKEQALKDFHAQHPDQYVEHYEGDFELPEDRTHRDAWTISKSGSIIVDKNKIEEAKELISLDVIEARLNSLAEEVRLIKQEK